MTRLFLPEWVVEVFYGGDWYEIKKGTYHEFESDRGTTVVYTDTYNDLVVIVTEPITGFKIEQPEPQPEATVTPLHKT